MPPSCVRPARRAPSGPATLVIAGVLLFCLALIPRAQSLDRYVTVDEDLTLGRTGNFADALATGRWQRTYQIGHPEVTVMWVAALALGPTWAREFVGSVQLDGQIYGARDVVERPGFLPALARARLGLAVVNSLLLAIAALLLWRLAGPAAGLLGGAMLALEPFLVAHGQLLRADALLAELILVAVLAGCAYWLRGAGLWALLLSSAATALALLAKMPALVLLPVIALVVLLAGRRRRLLPLWAAGVAVVYVGLWPAMWVRPLETVRRVVEYTAAKGGAPMDAGSFLFGQALADPGPLFYPAALALRLSPLALAGLLALLWRRPRSDRVLLTVLLFAVLAYGAAMALAPKKSDRYMLPLIPLLATLAGLGAAELARRWRTRGVGLGLGAIVLGQAAGLLAIWPYPMAYYNPLAGGGAVASQTILVGWGEGLDQVAAALNRLPDASLRTAAVFYPDALGAQFVGETVPLAAYDVADYAILYIASDQRNLTPPSLAAALVGQPPELEVHLNGIRYAQVYRLARREFGGGIVLDQIDLSDRTVARGDPVKLALRWAVQAPDAAGFRSRVSLLQADGRVVAESLGPPHAGPLADQSLLEERHRLRAPDRLGRYTVAVSLQAEPGGQPLPVVGRPPGLQESATDLIFRSVWVRVQ